VLPESLVEYRLRQCGHARRCSRSSRTCCATTKSCTPANNALLSVKFMPSVSIASSRRSIVRTCRRCSSLSAFRLTTSTRPSWPQPPALCQRTQTCVGLFQAEPIWLQRSSEFVQSSIDALKALLEHGAEQIPGPCRLTRAGLGQHLNTSLQPYVVGMIWTIRRRAVHRGELSAFRLPESGTPVARCIEKPSQS